MQLYRFYSSAQSWVSNVQVHLLVLAVFQKHNISITILHVADASGKKTRALCLSQLLCGYHRHDEEREEFGIEIIKLDKKEIGGDVILSNLKSWTKGIYGMMPRFYTLFRNWAASHYKI